MQDALFIKSLSPLRGSQNQPNHYPRLVKPHLGLNYAAAPQLSQREKGWRSNSSAFADPADRL